MKRLLSMSGLFIVFLLLLAGIGHAEIFRWTDAEGVTHFGDRPPPSVSAKHVTVDINSYKSVSIEPFTAFQRDHAGGGGSVVLYGTTWCGFCKRARSYFQAQGIPYTEYDVEKTEKGRRDYKKLNGHGVPIILVGNRRMNGFSVDRFKSLYKGAKK